jgi:hypothetical protein
MIPMATDVPRNPAADRGAIPVRRRAARVDVETKPATRTTELYAYVAAVAGVLVAGLVTTGGAGSDKLLADQVWLFVTILTAGYMISRGLAKAGSYEPVDADEARR